MYDTYQVKPRRTLWLHDDDDYAERTLDLLGK